MKPLTAQQIIAHLEERGWYEDRQKGSHKIFKNWNDPLKHTVVPFHKGKIGMGTDPTERLFFRRLAVEAGEMWHREVQK